jgi:glutamate dehydrogenase
MWATLRRFPEIASQVVQMFHTRFDPRLELSVEERGEKQAEFVAAIETALSAVESLDEDRILRHFVNAVTSALRTNFYQTDSGQPKPTIAIKFDSRKIDGLPLPQPLYEIFVYSPRVEGVHLRFGKVARGGIRWSDRPQDFRTEVLGLVKAQQVKNAVIVPVGAKGGFVPKHCRRRPREAIQAEGTPPTRCSSRACSTSPTISARRRDPARERRAPRRRRSLSGGRRRQGHRDLLRHAQRHLARARLLARRRFRLRRLGRL